MLFVKRAVCPLLMRELHDLGEFVQPAVGNAAGRVVFAKRKRGAIGTSILLAAIERAAMEGGDERLAEIVLVSVGDRLPLHNYPVPSPMAPLGHTGRRLLDFFGQHPDESTYLMFADVAVHVPLSSDPLTGDTIWPLYAKLSAAERLLRPAPVVNLASREMDQYNQYGMGAGWMKLRFSPNRRMQLAEAAIDSHAEAARDELWSSRRRGTGAFWDAAVCAPAMEPL
jgi:hypothetical protein